MRRKSLFCLLLLLSIYSPTTIMTSSQSGTNPNIDQIFSNQGFYFSDPDNDSLLDAVGYNFTFEGFSVTYYNITMTATIALGSTGEVILFKTDTFFYGPLAGESYLCFIEFDGYDLYNTHINESVIFEVGYEFEYIDSTGQLNTNAFTYDALPFYLNYTTFEKPEVVIQNQTSNIELLNLNQTSNKPFDMLNLQFDVNSTKDNLEVDSKAYIRNPQENLFIDYGKGSNSTILNEGINRISIDIYGYKLYRAQVDGNFSIELQLVYENTSKIIEISHLYNNVTLNWADFKPSPIYFSSSSIEFIEVDTDDDSLFEFLNITLPTISIENTTLFFDITMSTTELQPSRKMSIKDIDGGSSNNFTLQIPHHWLYNTLHVGDISFQFDLTYKYNNHSSVVYPGLSISGMDYLNYTDFEVPPATIDPDSVSISYLNTTGTENVDYFTSIQLEYDIEYNLEKISGNISTYASISLIDSLDLYWTVEVENSTEFTPTGDSRSIIYRIQGSEVVNWLYMGEILVRTGGNYQDENGTQYFLPVVTKFREIDTTEFEVIEDQDPIPSFSDSTTTDDKFIDLNARDIIFIWLGLSGAIILVRYVYKFRKKYQIDD